MLTHDLLDRAEDIALAAGAKGLRDKREPGRRAKTRFEARYQAIVARHFARQRRRVAQWLTFQPPAKATKATAAKEYNPDQPRDDDGKWSGEGGGGGGSGGSGGGGGASGGGVTGGQSLTDQDSELMSHYAGQVGDATNAQTNALREYQYHDYRQINGYLREDEEYSGNDKRNKTSIKNIDAIMDRTSTPRQMTVHRGIEGDSDFVASLNANIDHLEGAVISDPGYTSTTIDPGITTFGRFKMHIIVPKGSRGIYANALRGAPEYSRSEKEFLLPRGSKFKVTRVVYTGSGAGRVITDLHMEIVT